MTPAPGGRRQVLFVQGGGAGVHDEWDQRLVASLRAALGPGYEVRYPRMPREEDPSIDAWGPVLERELAALGDDAVLVGHSVGGTILIHTLASRAPCHSATALFLLAAPFLGDGGWPAPEGMPLPRLDVVDAGDMEIHIVHGAADEVVPASHAESYARAIPGARLHLLPGRDHQLGDDLREVAEQILTMTEST